MGDRRSIPTTKFLPSFFHNSIFSPFSFVFQVPLYKTHFFCSLFLSSISYFSGRLKFHYRRHISFIPFPPSCLYRFSFVGWSPANTKNISSLSRHSGHTDTVQKEGKAKSDEFRWEKTQKSCNFRYLFLSSTFVDLSPSSVPARVVSRVNVSGDLWVEWKVEWDACSLFCPFSSLVAMHFKSLFSGYENPDHRT